MISAIMFGRNDAHGYNIHKRAAISFNCIAEVLTHQDDEIIFVDCNTPYNICTFPEAIKDTLTPKARKLIRILRIWPHLYEKYKNSSTLKVLDPLSRNIAIKRANPSNRWILLTIPDNVFICRDPKKSLSDIAAELSDGFYMLPRFDVPEELWESSLDRTNPQSTIEKFYEWGKKLHLNEAVLSRPDHLFEAGDFQLILRKQMFEIHGLNEEMVNVGNTDHNLSKRLLLLNKKINPLTDKVFAYHCDHTRHGTLLQNPNAVINDLKLFVLDVNSPYLANQSENWGIPGETVDEITLNNNRICFSEILKDLLPETSETMTFDFNFEESYNHGQIYNNYHAFPFLANHLTNIPSSTNIGYFGGNTDLLILTAEFLKKNNHKGRILVDNKLFTYSNNSAEQCKPLNDICKLTDRKELLDDSDLFIFDCAAMHLPQFTNSQGIPFPKPSPATEYFNKGILNSLIASVDASIKLQRTGSFALMPRKFVFVGIQNTWLEGITREFIDYSNTAYCTHVMSGYIKKNKRVNLFKKIKIWIIFSGFKNKEKLKKNKLLNKTAKLIYKNFIR